MKPARTLESDRPALETARGARVRLARRRAPAERSRGLPRGTEAIVAPLLEALVEDADVGILVLDPERRVRRINRAATALLGVSASGARGRPAAELLRPLITGDDPLAGAVPDADHETMLVSERGGELPVAIRVRRVGRPSWRVVTLRDLSQLRRMHEELRRHERLALLGQLATGVAHEIRNPLAGIGTSAQVLLRRFEPRDERARFVQVILDEVARLDRIVTSLLQYSRPRTPMLQRLPLEPLVRKVMELVHEPAASTGVAIELDVAPRLPPVFVDPDLVTQVLLNVSNNALQAMPSGGVLRYEVRRVRRRAPPRGIGRRTTDLTPSPGRRTPWTEFQQVRVSDTGAGMSRGVLGKLFHPFFTTKPDGTGLGLSICQTIMHEHRGGIEVASREGRGTTVMLHFPLEKRHGERRDGNPHAGGARAPRR